MEKYNKSPNELREYIEHVLEINPKYKNPHNGGVDVKLEESVEIKKIGSDIKDSFEKFANRGIIEENDANNLIYRPETELNLIIESYFYESNADQIESDVIKFIIDMSADLNVLPERFQGSIYYLTFLDVWETKKDLGRDSKIFKTDLDRYKDAILKLDNLPTVEECREFARTVISKI